MASDQNSRDHPTGDRAAAGAAARTAAAAAPPMTAAARLAVRSMTGYAHRSEDTAAGRVTLELRSVNSRFTDLQFRLGDDLRMLEPKLREHIVAVVSRGKIECRLQVRAREQQTGGIRLDEPRILSLAQADARIRALVPHAAPLTVADYLRWQEGAAGFGGSSRSAERDGEGTDADDAAEGPAATDHLWASLQPVVARVLAEFVASREREGARLAATILRHVEGMKAVAARLEPLIPELLALNEAKLMARVESAMPEAGNGIPPEETFARIRQEVALLSLRGDVAEEFERLVIHLAEVERTVDQGGAIGKRLDFLTQELNREANTLASKAGGIAVTDGAVALKLLIEQVREQVQNIE
jgi:uncharacterized protein YicC (UPF0701 family)